jgi:hypothetical protein
MSFGADLNRFERKLAFLTRAVFLNSASAVKQSIVEGSAITGAPGQPVEFGTLKGSWILDFPDPNTAEITSGGAVSAYNRVIEENVRGAQLRSQVGGFHSVALTRAGFGRIVAHEAVKLGATGGT